MKFKPGKYYVGDPCYVIADARWNEVCTQLFADGEDKERSEITLDGITFWMHCTAHGDGGYTDGDGNEYGVDSGTIGIVPLELISNMSEAIRLGHIHEFGFEIEPSYEDGVFNIGPVEINTDPQDDEDEFEDEEEEEFVEDFDEDEDDSDEE